LNGIEARKMSCVSHCSLKLWSFITKTAITSNTIIYVLPMFAVFAVLELSDAGQL